MTEGGASAPEQHRGRAAPWQPGQSGNPAGRKPGSRNKLGEDFIQALYADFQEHGAAAIVEVRESKPDAYLKVIASILPKELKITGDLAEMPEDELDRTIRRLAAVVSQYLGPEAGLGGGAGGEAAPGLSH